MGQFVGSRQGLPTGIRHHPWPIYQFQKSVRESATCAQPVSQPATTDTMTACNPLFVSVDFAFLDKMTSKLPGNFVWFAQHDFDHYK